MQPDKNSGWPRLLELQTQSHPVPNQFYTNWLPALLKIRLGESQMPYALLARALFTVKNYFQVLLLSFQAV